MAFEKWHYPKCFHHMSARITCLFTEGNERVMENGLMWLQDVAVTVWC